MFEFLKDDKGYNKLCEEFKKARNDAYAVARGGYRDSFIAERTQGQGAAFKELAKTWANEYIDNANDKLDELNRKAMKGNDEDPQRELLNRQDFDVKLDLMSDDELSDFVHSKPHLSAYEFSKISNRINAMNNNMRDRLHSSMTELKQDVFEPARHSEEYQTIKGNTEYLASVDTHRTGNLPIINEDGRLKMIDFNAEINNAISDGKTDYENR